MAPRSVVLTEASLLRAAFTYRRSLYGENAHALVLGLELSPDLLLV